MHTAGELRNQQRSRAKKSEEQRGRVNGIRIEDSHERRFSPRKDQMRKKLR